MLRFWIVGFGCCVNALVVSLVVGQMTKKIDDDGWLELSYWQSIMPVEHIPSPNQNNRPSDEISLLVIHNISLPPGQFGEHWITDLFLNRLDPQAHPYFAEIYQLEVSAHVLIRRDGEVLQYVSFEQRAWHAGNSSFAGKSACNDFSIGIELEGCDDQPFTSAQYECLTQITAAIMAKYPEITADRITGHSDIAPGRKTDPGPHFDWQHYRTAITA